VVAKPFLERTPAMKFLNLETGVRFAMGKVDSRRVVHPDMGARQLTLNYSLSQRGMEFPQHTHDESEDLFLVMEGGVDVRQGDSYSPLYEGEAAFIPGGEVHGTITTSHFAALISFQSPPDMKLYSGDRDSSKQAAAPVPADGHVSGVRLVDLKRASPVFCSPGVWRSVSSAAKGAKHLGVDFVWLNAGDTVEMPPTAAEEVWVVVRGQVGAASGDQQQTLAAKDVVFLERGDTLALAHVGVDRAEVVRCRALGGAS
jgi:quercetin dioxygenase-like cupin family protein